MRKENIKEPMEPKIQLSPKATYLLVPKTFLWEIIPFLAQYFLRLLESDHSYCKGGNFFFFFVTVTEEDKIIINKQENSQLLFFRHCLKVYLCEWGFLKHFHTFFPLKLWLQNVFDCVSY